MRLSFGSSLGYRGQRCAVPDLHAIPAARGQVPAVRAEGYSINRARKSTQGTDLLSSTHVPYFHIARPPAVLAASRSESFAVRAESHTPDARGVTAEVIEWLPRHCVPD